MPDKIPRHARGDFLRAQEDWNVCAEIAELTQRIAGAGGTRVSHSLGGIVIWSPPATKLALWKLTEALQYPDPTRTSGEENEPTVPWTDNAQLLGYDSSLWEYAVDTLQTATLHHPTAFRKGGTDIAIGLPTFRAGSVVLAWLNPLAERWEIIAPPLDVWRFELKDALTPGGNATAYLLEWSGAAYAEDTDIEFEVYDVLGTRRGRAKTDTVAGAQGYAQYMPDADRWEIIDMQHQAREIDFTLDGALATTDASATVTVDAYHDGYDPDPAAGGLTVYNKSASADYIFEGASGAKGVAVFDPLDNKYYIRQMECP